MIRRTTRTMKSFRAFEERRDGMKRGEIKALLRSLARSQGMYGRLLRDIESMDKADQEDFWSELEAQNFKDELDVIMYFENGESRKRRLESKKRSLMVPCILKENRRRRCEDATDGLSDAVDVIEGKDTFNARALKFEIRTTNARARVCRPFVEAYERDREEQYSYAEKLDMDFVTYCDRVLGLHLKSLLSASVLESIAQAFCDISDLMRSGEPLSEIKDMAERHFSQGAFDGDVFRVEYGKHRDGYYPKGVSIEVYLHDERKNIVWRERITVDDSCKTAERVRDRIDNEVERVSDSWDDFRRDELRGMTRAVSERRKCRRNFESILSSRSPSHSEYSSLMAEPTRQLLYSLTDVVENRVKETLSSIANDLIPAPYADYDGETYSTTEISVNPSDTGLLISTGYPSYLSMDFSIRILETDDSLQTLQNSYSIPKTFTLSISYDRNRGVEMDIMDFTRADMNEIAQYIADSVAEEFKNSIESQGLKYKKDAVTVEWLAYAIQFEYDHNRRKKGGRVVKRDGTNADFAFLEIPSVGDLLIQDLADSIQFTLYKHGYKKELKSFTMSKAELSRNRGSSAQARPVLDRLLNET